MTVTLACTWRPRGEIDRFRQLRPELEGVYHSIVIAVPPDTALEDVQVTPAHPGLLIVKSHRPGWGRYVAIQEALKSSSSHMHYADMDRLLHWLEITPHEWTQTIEAIRKTDCLILGRTARAFGTHPQALQQTERIINAVASHVLGRPVDVGGGMRGLSRRAAEYLIGHSTPASWGDAAWPILLQRAGFAVDYLALDGNEWESADRYRQRAADPETQRRIAAAYDQDAKHWATRVDMALEIVQEALAAAPHSQPKP